MTNVPRTVHCGNLCVHHQPSQQYPGGEIGTAVSVHIGGGTLPFTGLGAEGVALLLVAALLVLGGAAARLWETAR